jgi:hypothetical protein
MKKPMKGLYRDNPATPEGKYLVKRRDGTVVEWPSFVLGAKDPMAPAALRAYAHAVRQLLAHEPDSAAKMGLSSEFADRIDQLAQDFLEYRLKHGIGDPGMGPHRKDDPATIAEMKQGLSA